jgi:CheY-like chemotaxis protein
LVRETIRLLLDLDGHTVVEAANAAQALELFLREGFDLVITDFRLPDFMGDKLIAQMRQIIPTQQILLMSVSVDGRFSDIAFSANGILAKPILLQDLQYALAKL